MGSIQKMDLTFGYNKTDVSYGWSGKHGGIRLFYLYPSNTGQLEILRHYHCHFFCVMPYWWSIFLVYQEAHGLDLSATVSPIIHFDLKRTTFLNHPFTACFAVRVWWNEVYTNRYIIILDNLSISYEPYM